MAGSSHGQFFEGRENRIGELCDGWPTLEAETFHAERGSAGSERGTGASIGKARVWPGPSSYKQKGGSMILLLVGLLLLGRVTITITCARKGRR